MNGKAMVYFDGIRIEGVKSLTLHKTCPPAAVGGLHGFTATLRGRIEPGSPLRWMLVSRARLSRMHAAYGRRRGRGRW